MHYRNGQLFPMHRIKEYIISLIIGNFNLDHLGKVVSVNINWDFKNWGIVDIQYYISFKCTTYWYNIFIDYTPVAVIILAKFPVLYDIFLLPVYFIHSSLYCLITYPYIAPPSFPLPTCYHQFVSVSLSLFCYIHYLVLFFRVPI